MGSDRARDLAGGFTPGEMEALHDLMPASSWRPKVECDTGWSDVFAVSHKKA